MKSIGKTIVLVMVILIMIFGGLLWFQYLGLMPNNSIFSPIFSVFGMEPQTSVTATDSSNPVTGDLAEDRLNASRDQLNIFEEELNQREQTIQQKEKELEQLAAVIKEKEKTLEEREKTFNQMVNQYDDKNSNIEQIAVYLNSMAPKDAVPMLENMDDQLIIDILRKVDQMAQANGTASMSSVWLMQMKSDRAAQISRKMINKPESLN